MAVIPIMAWGGLSYVASDLLNWLDKDDGSPPPSPISETPVGNNIATLAVVSVVGIGAYFAYKKLS